MKKMKPLTTGAAPMVAPDWLSDGAKVEWRRILTLPGLSLDARDVAVLAAYCQNWARWVESEQMLTEHGCEIVIRDDKGTVKSVVPSPWIGIGTKAHDRMLKAARELGLGPERRMGAGVKATNTTAAVLPDGAAAEWFGDVN